MKSFGYIFLAQDKNHLVPLVEQQTALQEYCRSLGRRIEELFVEDAVAMKHPLKARPVGGKLLASCAAGDAIIVMKTEWVLNSPGDGQELLRLLGRDGVSLHCLDLGGNISVPEKRRLLVSEGPAALVGKLLAALSVRESSRHGQAIRTAKKQGKEQGRYLGGPVPFGWEVGREGRLVANEEQQQIIRSIAEMRDSRRSYREISRKLKEEYQIRLSHEGVRRILASPAEKAGRGKS